MFVFIVFYQNDKTKPAKRRIRMSSNKLYFKGGMFFFISFYLMLQAVWADVLINGVDQNTADYTTSGNITGAGAFAISADSDNGGIGTIIIDTGHTVQAADNWTCLTTQDQLVTKIENRGTIKTTNKWNALYLGTSQCH